MHPLNCSYCFLRFRNAQLLSQIQVQYDFHFPSLSIQDELALRAVLGRYIYYQTFVDNYSLADAITDTMPDLEARICQVMLALEGISPQEAEILVEWITTGQTYR